MRTKSSKQRIKIMKITTALILLTGLSINGFAQEKINKVSVDPLQLFALNIANFEYERGFNEGKIGVSFFYGSTGNTTREINGLRAFLTEQNVGIKSYSKTISESSLWFGGQLSVASGSFRDVKDVNNRATGIGTLGLSGKLGYQFIHNSFYLDFFGSVGYAITNDLFGTASYNGNIEEANILLTVGIKTGIAF